MTNKEASKMLIQLATHLDSHDNDCNPGGDSFDKWCDLYDKLFLNLLTYVVEESVTNEMMGNLLLRLSKYSTGVCNNKGRIR